MIDSKLHTPRKSFIRPLPWLLQAIFEKFEIWIDGAMYEVQQIGWRQCEAGTIAALQGATLDYSVVHLDKNSCFAGHSGGVQMTRVRGARVESGEEKAREGGGRGTA